MNDSSGDKTMSIRYEVTNQYELDSSGVASFSKSCHVNGTTPVMDAKR